MQHASSFTVRARRLFHGLFTQAPRLLVTGALLWSSSCSTMDRWTAKGPVVLAPNVTAKVKQERGSSVTHAYASSEDSETESGVRPLSHQQTASASPPPQTNDPFAAATANERPFDEVQRDWSPVIQDDSVRTIANVVVEDAGEPVAQAVPEQVPMLPSTTVPRLPAADSAVVVLGHDPRVDLPTVPSFCPPQFHPPGTCPPGSCPPIALPGLAQFPPEDSSDEYICDGGDRHPPVHYNGFTREGLGVEDTVVEYLDSNGELQVKATNRTCVYAPRFGSVRSMTAPNEQYHVARAVGTHDRRQVAGFEHRMVIDEQVQRDEPKNLDSRSRASGVAQMQVDGQLAMDLRAVNHGKATGPSENFAFFREGQFDLVDGAHLADAIDAALAWSTGQPPIVQGHLRSGFAVQSRAYAQEQVGVEDQRTPADLQVTKLADKKVAEAGDTITFTLRFDNLGGHEVLEFRLIDHLSPRLEYIEGSVDADLDGKLDVQPGTSGGQILTFEFTQPLQGHAGGYVSFKCKVR